MLTQKKIAIIGVGKMGEALITGLRRLGKVDIAQVVGTTKHAETGQRAASSLGISIAPSNREAVEGRDIVILAVKPQGMRGVLQEVGPALRPDALVISIAASVPTGFIERTLARPFPVVRVMPNTPCLLGQGMSVLCRGSHATDIHIALAEEIFRAVGRTTILDEHLMDAATGLSGSGPAYIYLVIEALAEGGVKVGIPRETSLLLAAQTVLGAAQMVLELGEHPALLKDMVTTPAGCTVDGLLELEEGGTRVSLIKAVVKATERAHQLVSG